MNLRHIDPRSTDWMDAMLEGESERKRKPEAEGQGGLDAKSPVLLAGGKTSTTSTTATPETLGSPPAPSR